MSESIEKEDMHRVFKEAECLVSIAELKVSIEQLGLHITEDWADLDPIVLCVMNGALVFCGHLLPHLQFPMALDYIHATRYGKDLTGGELKWLVKPSKPLQDRNVLIIDDILDEGTTLKRIKDYCLKSGARRVETVVLLDKQHERKYANMVADYCALEVDDRFIFGFGLDYKGYWRNAPGIFAVKGL